MPSEALLDVLLGIVLFGTQAQSKEEEEEIEIPKSRNSSRTLESAQQQRQESAQQQ